jgi:hypothetical protein
MYGGAMNLLTSLLIAGLVGLSVGVSGTYKVVADHYRAEAAAQKDADAKAYQVRTLELNDVSAELERAKSEKQIVYRTITKRVETYIDRPVYQRECLDDDGLRDANAALAGRASASQSDAAVPAAGAAGR